MSAVSISKKLNIASSTASEFAMRGRQIVKEHGWKLLEEIKSEIPRNLNVSGHEFKNETIPWIRRDDFIVPQRIFFSHLAAGNCKILDAF